MRLSARSSAGPAGGLKKACAIAGSLAMLAGTVESQTQPAFRSSVDAVRVDVLATVGNTPISGLTADDFELWDNNKPQQIDTVAIENLPVSMLLVLDTSLSVSGEALDDLKRGARAALAALGTSDRAALMTFSENVVLRADWTGDVDLLGRAIDATRPGGGTALLDAAHKALTLRDSLPDRRSLVLMFSDGNDTSSSWTPLEVWDRAQRSDSVVYGITANTSALSPRMVTRANLELGFPGPGPGPANDVLKRLADVTGGQSFTAKNTGRLSEAFKTIVEEFRTRYLLTFTPKNVTPTGWHNLRVTLKNRPGKVRARRGYLR